LLVKGACQQGSSSPSRRLRRGCQSSAFMR
jgi:hypothetical protein